jgi:hypothetical protein
MRKRSSYRPRTLMTDPLLLLKPAPKSERDAVMLRFLTALETVASGDHPGEQEWRDLADAVNTVETLALKLGKLVPDEVMPVVNAAIAAMVLASRRYLAGQGMRVDGPGLQALRDVVAIYGECMERLTGREMAVARYETIKRMEALLRRRASDPDAKVIAL